MNLEERIEAFSELGRILKKIDLDQLYPTIRAKNDWFTQDMVDIAFQSIYSQMLNKEKLYLWLDKYEIYLENPKSVALVLAGNIPAVGFHDILCVLLSGHSALIKLSSKDPIIIPFILKHLTNVEPRFENRFQFIDKLENFDAVIATGSNNSNLYFKHYFDKYPTILRSNRKSLGIIYHDTSDKEIAKIADDIFLYYGLGCRNISKLFIQSQVNLENIMKIFHERNDIILHNKYKNNFDYNYTISLLNGDDFLMSGSLIMRKNSSIHSRIATIHYETFEDDQKIIDFISKNLDEIQCIVSPKEIDAFSVVAPGMAQFPELSDYADQKDTIEFLIKL